MSDQGKNDAQAEEPLLRFTITPEPEGDEGEALIAAITIYLSATNQPEIIAGETPNVSRWGSAGKRSGIRGLYDEKQMGWGRRSAGWP